MERFEVKDSGERISFESGMQRDTADDKIDYSLVADGVMLKRYAIHMSKGAAKYSKRNWLKASGQEELERFRESAFRHFIQWYYGEQEEDHFAATIFNMNGHDTVKELWSQDSQLLKKPNSTELQPTTP